MATVEMNEEIEMEILMNLWLAFNIVFGIWTARNVSIRVIASISRRGFIQSDLGKFLDLMVLVSVLAYVFSI